MRYVLEMLNREGRRAKNAARKLKKVQNALRLHHDSVATLDWLRGISESATLPPATLLPAGAVYPVVHQRVPQSSRSILKSIGTAPCR
jgi:CHAD domain-containing protein